MVLGLGGGCIGFFAARAVEPEPVEVGDADEDGDGLKRPDWVLGRRGNQAAGDDCDDDDREAKSRGAELDELLALVTLRTACRACSLRTSSSSMRRRR